jgi:hypothetical protein
MVKRVQTAAELLVEPRNLDRTRLVMLFKQPERFPVVVLSSLSLNNGPKPVQEGADAFIEKSSLLENPRLLLEAVMTALPRISVS